MKKEPFQPKSELFLSHEEWESSVEGLLVGFTTKNGGVSHDEFSTLNLGLHVHDNVNDVVTNRKILAKCLKTQYEKWVFAEQVHGHHIVKVSKNDCGKGLFSYEDGIAGCDGLYTTEKGVMLSLCFADCVPIYFLEPNRKIIGIVHAGWKGTVSDICREFIHIWKNDEQISPSEIKVSIGPAIGSCCYIVDNRVIHAIEQLKNKQLSQSYKQLNDGQYKLNLKQLNKYLLLEAGVKEENITVSQYCTCCDDEKFFSHRRDEGKTGRMLSFIGMNREA